MFCTNCGNEISATFRFCPQCGAATERGTDAPGAGQSYSARPVRPFVRPRNDRKIAGVAAGIAQYLNLDVILVRIVLLCLAIFPPGIGLIFYLICWIVVPNEPYLLIAPLEPPPSNAPSGAPAAS
jgi:phage shock protein C